LSFPLAPGGNPFTSNLN